MTRQSDAEGHRGTVDRSAPAVLIPHSVGLDRAEAMIDHFEDVIEGPLLVAHTPEETLEMIADVEVVVTNRLTEEQLAAADELGWVHATSAGVDHFDHDGLTEQGVVLTSSAGIHAEPIAEQVLCYMLTFERNMHRLRENQFQGVWQRIEGGELHGKTLGIVGVGSIGTRVAELGSALGMEIHGTKRDLDTMPDVVDQAYPAEDYHELLGPSEYLVIACPLTSETRGLLGMDEFLAMGSDTVLVNIARGEIVRESHLVRALQERIIRGAALDAFTEEPLDPESPLWDLSNVIVTPHMAGSTPYKAERWRELLARNYPAFVSGDLMEMQNVVIGREDID